MTAAEEGVLLLCCKLGDPNARPLTMAQFRELGNRVRMSVVSGNSLRQIVESDLAALGYDEAESRRIYHLLQREEQLRRYLRSAERLGIRAVTRISQQYPQRIAACRKLSSPPVLFCRGDVSLFARPAVSLVGSRKLREPNRCFAAQVGRLAAEEGYVLVSGGAEGADRMAQEACLAAGGHVIVFVPDRLDRYPAEPRVLYCSEDGYDLGFTNIRALHRNGLIHMQGGKTLVAQCGSGEGGTWQGSVENLRHGWSDLFVFEDGSEGAQMLMERGATGIRHLQTISGLSKMQQSWF